MYQCGVKIPFGNLLLSLSEAVELCSPTLMHHQLRTAFIAWEIAKQAGLSPSEIEILFLAALFHDVGALTPEEKTQIHQFEEKNSDRHCRMGANLFGRVPWMAPAAAIVRYHHHRWDERSAIEFGDVQRDSQILMLADHLERRIDRSAYILHQHDEVISQLESLAGDYFDPQIVACLKQAADREEFWLDLTSPRLYSLLLHFGPYQKKELALDDLQDIANFFSYLIDFRSRFTATHSAGVTACACRLAQLFGLTSEEVKTMGIAGQLHDLGKLSVPNAILEKPSGLTKEEFAIIKRHTYHTYSVLNMIGGMGPIPEWAAFHHERLDGSGYPFRIDGQKISSGSRIMQVADIFTAMAESRPYRKTGMSKDQIVRIFRDRVEDGILDRRMTKLLLDDYDAMRGQVLIKQEEAVSIYESFFSDQQHFDNRLCAA